MLKVRVLKSTYRDLAQAKRWYERIQAGLGAEVEAEFYQALDEVAAVGWSFSEDALGFRHVRLRRFRSYAIFFDVVGGIARVSTLFHSSRDPKKLETLLRHRRHHQP